MSLAIRTNGTVTRSADRYRDPFAIARDLLTWDPFYVGRAAPAFTPAFEVKDTPDAYVLKADLPGVTDADLEISVHNNTLTVAGSRQSEERKDGETYSLHERQFGAFTRSFSLPELADGENIAAKLEAGVLTLTIAKKAEAKPRRIALAK
jgi:HSP20 family protein